MEKFSKFKDPLTGINPFLAPTGMPITIKTIVMALLTLPIYLLYLLNLPVVNILFTIKLYLKDLPKGLIYSNSVTFFDKRIIQETQKISKFGRLKNWTCAFFPEKTNTNNKGILKYENEDSCEYVIGLKYSSNCVYLYGSKLRWFINFLGNRRTVEIRVNKGFDLSGATGLPKLSLDYQDKLAFLEILQK